MSHILDEQIVNLIVSLRKDTEILLNDLEAYQLYSLAKKTEKIEGDIAELGVYQGGTAKIIREALKNKPFHLFDTFRGLPPLGKLDESNELKRGAYKCRLKDVEINLGGYTNIYYYPGNFPFTSIPIRSKQFSFVHLDADLYKSTISALKFFYPKLNKGGIIMSHDYPDLSGVKKSFDKFFSDKKEIIIELPNCSQCVIVKVENYEDTHS